MNLRVIFYRVLKVHIVNFKLLSLYLSSNPLILPLPNLKRKITFHWNLIATSRILCLFDLLLYSLPYQTSWLDNFHCIFEVASTLVLGINKLSIVESCAIYLNSTMPLLPLPHLLLHLLWWLIKLFIATIFKPFPNCDKLTIWPQILSIPECMSICNVTL